MPSRIHLLPFISLLICHISAVRSQPTDLNILLDFKSKLSNPSALSSWLPNLPPCNFSGVTCVSSSSVSALSLPCLGLRGPLPLASLCSLPSLRLLSLPSNSLLGPLPPDLSNCTSLRRLDLSSNSLSGSVPDLSALSHLTLLNLSANLFSGPFPWPSLLNLTSLVSLSLGDNPSLDPFPFPDEILQLRNLSWLYFTNCSITGEIPPAIGNLTALVNLELSDNYLTGPIPPEITKLACLFQLELWGNNLTGIIPAGFRNLSGLQFFDASINGLEGGLDDLRYLNNIVSLQLFENHLSGEIPAEFGDFQQLVNLSLYGNRLSGTLPEKLGSWADFDFIDVSDNYLSGPIPPNMCKKGKMRKLLLMGNNFSGEIPATYADCRSLFRLRVKWNSLSGRVPDGIWGLPELNIIELSYNRFEGPIPSDIAAAVSLEQIYISNNRFSGPLPPEISRAASLNLIDAGYNDISGEIPSSIGQLRKLDRLLLQGNRIDGGIPTSLSSCTALDEINLAGNNLEGEIPASLASMDSLNFLNLSHNRLSGQIPAALAGLKLSVLDLSENQLYGPVPEPFALGAFGLGFAGNRGLCSSKINYLQRCASDSANPGRVRKLVLSSLAIVAATLAAFGCCCYVVLVRRRGGNHRRSSTDSLDLQSFRSLSFKEEDILNSIKKENLIGKGGSGCVYRVVLASGKNLAAKHIWCSGSGEGEGNRSSSAAMLGGRRREVAEFEAEVAALSSVRHVNVVKLYCSITCEDWRLLVYEYLENGSLWERLHACEGKVMGWATRWEVALGAAKGLEYLHHGCGRPVIHRDVKSSNILLDESFKPRIADFGLAKMIQDCSATKDPTRVVAGTCGYIAPEYAYTCNVSEKSDVYSFGVVLMELVTGKRPIEPEFGESKDIVYWVTSQVGTKDSMMELVDHRLPKESGEDALKVLRVGVLCTAKLPALRPSMKIVVQLLEEAEPCELLAIAIKNEDGSFDRSP